MIGKGESVDPCDNTPAVAGNRIYLHTDYRGTRASEVVRPLAAPHNAMTANRAKTQSASLLRPFSRYHASRPRYRAATSKPIA